MVMRQIEGRWRRYKIRHLLLEDLSARIQLRLVLDNRPPPLWVSIVVLLFGAATFLAGIWFSQSFDHGRVLGALSLVGGVCAIIGLIVYANCVMTMRRLSSDERFRATIRALLSEATRYPREHHLPLLDEVVEELDRRGDYRRAEDIVEIRTGLNEELQYRAKQDREA